MVVIDSNEKLNKLFKSMENDIWIYGDGTVARELALQIREYYGTLNKIKAFFVSQISGESRMLGKPVLQYEEKAVKKGQIIIVALGRKARMEVIKKLGDSKGKVYVIDSTLLQNNGKQEIYYEDCIGEVRGFLEKSNYSVRGLMGEKSDYNNKRYAWTCWWQGEEEAPDLVKACINSQKKNLPNEVEHIVITEKNCENYVEFPDYIMEKVKDGSITLTTFSDMLREKLLYKYGGIWFDATVLIHKPFPVGFFELPLYTCRGKKHHFSSYSQWSLWCMGGVKGNEIFKFLFDLFCEYYKFNNKIKYYLTVDYFIKAALVYVDGANDLYNEIPINNENSSKLAEGLKEEYSTSLFEELTHDTYLSKLTTKHFDGRNGENFVGFSDTSVYAYILEHY